MRIVSLGVEGFGIIKTAQVELGEGLNILHGPNDLGKSTLAEAVRAALLLQHTQKDHEKFIPWTDDVSPRVTLVLEMNDGFHRIKKTFGIGNRGKSTLEFSKNQKDWTMPHRGRDVDGQLREMLKWGVPGPGGKGGGKGMPEPFLSVVLLPDQERVAEILKRSLASDPDETGKLRLTEALEALAIDPLFKAVLNCSQAHVDEAYTTKGSRKSGASSPWTRAKDDVNTARAEVTELKQKVAASQDIVNQTIELSKRLSDHENAVKEAAAVVKELECLWAQQEKRSPIQAMLDTAKAELAEIEGLFSAHKKAEEEAKLLESAGQAKEVELGICSTEHERAEKALAKVEAEKARLEGGVQTRAFEQTKLKNRILELKAQITEISTKEQKVNAVVKAVDVLEESEATLGKYRRQSLSLTTQREEAESAEAKASDAVDELRKVLALSELLRAEARLTKIESEKNRAERLQGEATKLEQTAQAIEAALQSRVLASREELKTLRVLEKDLLSAEGKLGVGLSLTVEPDRLLEASITLDGQEGTKRTLTQPDTIEARSAIALRIEGVGRFAFTAGDPAQRAEAERLQRQWKIKAQPRLRAAKVTELEDLETAIAAAEDERRALQENRSEADRKRKEAEQVLAGLESEPALQKEIKQCEIPLRGTDRSALRNRFESIGPDQIDLEIDRATDALDQAKETIQTLNVKRAETKALLEASEESVAEKRQLVEALMPKLEDEPKAVVQRLRDTRSQLKSELEEVEKKLGQLEDEGKVAVVAIGKELESSTAALETAKAAKENANAEFLELRNQLAAARALATERKTKVEAAGIDGRRNKVVELKQQLAAIPEEPDLENSLEDARNVQNAAEVARKSVENELLKTKGALSNSGGGVVEEQEQAWEEALTRAEEKQSDLDTEYEGWRLLLETLKEVEKEEASHLGRALIKPLSEDFQALTQGWYGPVELGPDLETHGIVAAGQSRKIDSLSVGTKEQLATIVRMSLAKQLDSCIILDDQLTQSDAVRFSWILSLLYEQATQIQIIVLTCQPKAYLRPEQTETVRVIDLSTCIQRYQPPSTEEKGSE